jgi:exodeoxyribonuclease-3
MVKIISWNVNGIRSVIKKEEFQRCIQKYDPDIICLQETKAQEWQVIFPIEIIHKYPYRYWCDAEKKGYSGVLTMSKTEPLKTNTGFHIDCDPINVGLSHTEGRVVSTLWSWGWLVNVYTPNSKMDLSRLGYRTKQWDISFAHHCKILREQTNSELIICGDLNVAHKNIDVWSPTCSGPGLTSEERKSFEDNLLTDYVDSYRHFYPDRRQYSWWSNIGKARDFNKGWRLDYFMVSGEFMDKITDSTILDQQYGSDHCPIQLKLNM